MSHCGCLFSIKTNVTKIIIDAMVGTIYLSKICFTLDTRGELNTVQGGTPNFELPQSALLPKNDPALKFAKGPPDGISPDSLLNDKFKYLRYVSASRDLGIAPERLLFKRAFAQH